MLVHRFITISTTVEINQKYFDHTKYYKLNVHFKGAQNMNTNNSLRAHWCLHV